MHSTLHNQIAAAAKQTKADLVIQNGKIVNVFTREIIEGDLAIAEGMIVGIGRYEGEKTIDAEGRYICPGLIDGHVHIESSMVPPSEFARVVLPHGVTTVIADPHEIANVAGVCGIQFMLDEAKRTPLDVYMMLPSCVPAASFERAGAVLSAAELAPFFNDERVLGLAEVMDYPSLREQHPSMLDKLALAANANRLIDGHLAGLDADAVNVYRSARIHTDHECVTPDEALERVRRGMYVLIRQGSVAKDLKKLLPAIHEHNARRFLFCTDDKHLDDLWFEGSVDHNVRLAIQAGLDPLLAIQMATLNAAECYRLPTKGAVAPGYDADFLFVDDLETLNITHVFKAGRLVAQHGQAVFPAERSAESLEQPLLHSIRCQAVDETDLRIPMKRGTKAHVIEIIPNHLHTNHLITDVDVQEGAFCPSIERDLLKLVVVERHRGLGIGLGIVRGFGFKAGAIASSIAHDSHHIIAAGTNDRDLAAAIEQLREQHGGLAVIKDGAVLASLPLEIGGLMTRKDYTEVLSGLKQIDKALKAIGANGSFNPFITLSFLALPVIPELKLTDQGLFDVNKWEFIPVEAV
ncbi:adenine deaminase [Anoxybacillus geothermalis]|uniref:adenine deaminase n=1 Tax=Geobacillus stearothermophilus TaxID=1422 RepID=UPI002EB9EAE6|nr:adenine deaminase [Anoxybacillus geothermalis]